ncbi:MAG: hypothetical protein ACPG32_04210 [Akkermansiaceae bacterium]
MNKLTLAARSFVVLSQTLLRRASCVIRGEHFDPNPGPQWQQLELPFSRTPVKRWNR